MRGAVWRLGHGLSRPLLKLVHQLDPRLLRDQFLDCLPRQIPVPQQRLRDPFDLLPMALDDLLRPGELVRQHLVDACMQERSSRMAQLLDDIAVRLGGLAAEEVMLGDRSAGGGGASGSDLHSATLSALTFEASFGLGEGFAYLASEDEDELFNVRLRSRRRG